MSEQCHLPTQAPLLREDPYLTIPIPHVFCQTPPFRKDLEHSPTGKEWQKIAQDMRPFEDCVIHSKERIFYQGKKHQIRRLFYEWFIGPLKSYEDLKSTCKRKGCIYPAHLRICDKVSHGDAVFQMWKNREADKGLTQAQRAEKYKLPLWLVQKRDQKKLYKYLPSDDCVGEKQSKFIEPPTEIVFFDFGSVK